MEVARDPIRRANSHVHGARMPQVTTITLTSEVFVYYTGSRFS